VSVTLPPRSTSTVEQLLVDTLSGIGLGLLWVDERRALHHVNDTLQTWLSPAAPAELGQALSTLGPPLPEAEWQALWRGTTPPAPFRWTLYRPAAVDPAPLPVEVRCHRLHHEGQALMAWALTPIADRLEAESVEQLQRDVLEAVALGRPLAVVLDLLCRRVETLAPELICSVLSIENGRLLHPLAGPSLPLTYCAAIDGLAIGPAVGSCGTAAWRREAVEVTDIANDPLWAPYKGLALPLGLAACWSTPIISLDGAVVATFALYQREPLPARPLHRRMVEACAPLVRVAIQHEANRAEIERLAFFDPLTGLPNRRLFTDRARQVLQTAARLGQSSGAVLLLDIDRFKNTNDSLGHAAGDQVLIEVSHRLALELRDTDSLARLGGDEFAVLLPGCAPIEARTIADKLHRALSRPLVIGGMALSTSASIGISIYPEDGEETGLLLKNAEMAMYEAKRHGRNGSRFFTPALNQAADQRLQLETALRHAVSHEGLSLVYQPKLCLDSGACAGVEVLARWHDPALGNIPPDRFIPLAEECGLINALDAWVLESACAQLARWQAQGLAVPSVSVNVSPLRFHHDDVPAHVSQLLARHRLPASALTLEITERLMLNDETRTQSDLRALHDMGVRLSVDDFGTGYSSLGYLKRLPVSELKLDQRFVRDLETDAGDRALASAVIGIGQALGLQVVAEGVETPAQQRLLREAGCLIAQGFGLARPMRAGDLEAWLARPVHCARP